ncbi:MAG: ATP-binding cassette domain-containing protein [Cyanobacteriota bacterium]|jgi:ATP-binding cassette subfamily B protein
MSHTVSGSSAEAGSTLPPGSEHPWPNADQSQPDLCLLQGEVALIGVLRSSDGRILRRRTFACLKAPCVLSASQSIPADLELRFKVVRAATVTSAQDPSTRTLQTSCATATIPAPTELLRQLQPKDPATAAATTPATRDLLTTLTRWLAERHGTKLAPLTQAPADPIDRLRALLDRADLIAVSLQIDRADLRRDCGDLILLLDSGPLLLLSEANGYWLRDPASPEQPAQRLHASRLRHTPAPWQALGISPGLKGQDVSPLALVRFSYGPASHRALVLIAAATLGLAIGFLLAIGKEIGAARWIAGLGGVGVLLGAGLALLSDPLRPALITALLSTLLGLLIPTFNTLLTNQALPDKDVNLMVQMAALLLAAALSDVGLRWSESRTLLTVQQRGGHRLQLAALHRLLRLPASFFQAYRAGELALRFGAIGQVQNEIQSLISGGALQALLSAVFLLFMLRISVKLTLLAVVLALVLVGPTVWIGRRTLRLERKREEQLAEAGSRNLELITSVSKLRLAGVETSAARHWWEPYGASIRSGYNVQVRSALAGLLQTVMPNLGVLLLFILITRLVDDALAQPLQRVPNVGELLGFFSAFTTFIGAVVSSAALMVQAFELPVLLERAKPLLQERPETADPDRLDPGVLRGGVELEGVRFRYSADGPWVIDGLDLTIQPGEFVAVVGASGSGKSTLLRLLLGLERPQHGTIRFDGRPLERLRADLVRRQIGVVPQNAALLSGTIQEVIAGGALITSEQAWQAAQLAAIATEIQSFPMGMQTIISEGGGNLSGGQRQRLAIARALVRQPALLMLDEATSALDNISQAVVSRNLQQLGLTRIVVAHRLSTIRDADRIVMLEAGRVVQEGPFAHLIQEAGPFAEMMRRQRGEADGVAP